MFISVIFSFYNEEENIPELIRRVRASLRPVVGRDYEMIFVNDVSTDLSLEMLKAEADAVGDVKVVNMSRNFGVSPCVLAGMEHASGDAVIYMDADLQDPPEVIPEMISVWLKENVDVVHTRRLSRAGESRFKMLLTKIGYAILTRVGNIKLQPEVGDFKLLSRRAVNQLVRLKEKKPFTRGLVNWIGFKQTTITYHREERFSGETKFPVTSWKVISNFLDSALISFSDVPLKISLLLGFFVSFGAFMFLMVILIMKFTGYTLPGWAAIMTTVVLLGGFQLLTIGVLGLYINAIYLESKQRPNYIVESTYGFDHDQG